MLSAAAVAAGSGAAAPHATCGPPRLTILSPSAGETVGAPPLRVEYRARCFRLGPAPYGHIHVWTGPPATTRRLEVRPRRQAGSFEVGSPTLSGRHTLTFQLARAGHVPVRNPGARVVVRNVLFEGP
jgi:hypothetical protein